MNPITSTGSSSPATAMNGRLTRRHLFVLAASGAVVAACSTDGAGGATGTPGSGASENPQNGPRVLRFHDRTSAPDSLDPARGFGVPLGYDVLIYQAPDGSFQPQVAESWQYVGEGNRTFEITLRSDLTFSDGQPVNAEAVKANIEYRQDPAAGSQSATALASVTEVELVDELTVRIHLSEPDPLMPEIFSLHQGGPGILISPAALEDPGVLSTETFGVGRYKIDQADTVLGDRYTWVPDPNYWNPDEVYWDKIEVHHIPTLSSALAAMQSGQIDLMRADPTIIDAGKAAGFAVAGPGLPIVNGLSLIDRAGVTAPALGDVRVRQALNYAIDRETIVEALFGDSGVPSDQLSAPESSGWHDEPFYPYDPDRAARLLADAGHEDGFSFRVRITQEDMWIRLTEAIADNLRQIGVDLQIDAVPVTQYDNSDDATNKEYGGVILAWGISQPFRMARAHWLPDATNNTFDTVDDTLVQLDREVAVAEEEDLDDLNRQIIARVAELAWYLPVVVWGESILYNADVVDVPWTNFASFPYAIEYRPAAE